MKNYQITENNITYDVIEKYYVKLYFVNYHTLKDLV